MNKLESLARRIGEIGDEIATLKAVRLVALEKCEPSIYPEFEAYSRGYYNCLESAYQWVKESNEESGPGWVSFDETIRMYGCERCVAAYDAKKGIGLLKQERGRLVGNISKIGKTL